MNGLVVDQGWIATGGVLFLLLLVTVVYLLTRDSLGEEDVVIVSEPPESEDAEIDRLEKLEKVYKHFEYEEQGISFKDYVRKVDAGNQGELAEIR